MLFGHGDDLYNYDEKVKINFSSNVWYGAKIEKLNEHLVQNLSVLTHYPEPDASTIKRLVARRNELKEDEVLVTNGSISAFYMIANSWPKSKSMIFTPSFAEYEDAARLGEHELHFFSNEDDLSHLDLSDMDFCWICNPNNPDGKLYHKTELIALFKSNPEVRFIIDQAYVSFTTEDLFRPSDIKAYPNLILVHSISKAFRIPGARIGYIVASEENVAAINKYNIPWSVNSLAIEAGRYILIHPAQFTLPIRKWQRDTAEFILHLSKLDDIEVIPTSTTFFLVRLKKGKVKDLKEHLLKKHGILIRDASNFRDLDETFFRVCTQNPEENDLLVEALDAWLQTV